MHTLPRVRACLITPMRLLPGTFEAGIIAGLHSGGARGMLGVMDTARLAACRFLNSSGFGALSEAVACIKAMADEGAVFQLHG